MEINISDPIQTEIQNKINPATMDNIHVKLVEVPILAIYQNGQIMDTPIPLTDELAYKNDVLTNAMTKFKNAMTNASSSGGKRRKTNRKSHKRIRKTNRSRRVRW